MLACSSFHRQCLDLGIRFFTGVPDSLLQDFCAYLTDVSDTRSHIIAANEGGAVGLAIGHYLATGSPGLVYMQNSGQGNAANPLISLADSDVYGIPMLLLIGWRGEPGHKDEPQHVKQGKITLALLETMGIPHSILPDIESSAAEVLKENVRISMETKRPTALVIRKGTFSPYALKNKLANRYTLSREEAICMVAQALPSEAVVVATTGKASRELCEYRSRAGTGRATDFLTVGGMGHASQIALGIALVATERAVCCLDGDGAALMHLGAMGIAADQQPANYRHVLLNNGSHDSVGGQPTIGFKIDFCGIARVLGYQKVFRAVSREEVEEILPVFMTSAGPVFMELRVAGGAREDLGRPNTTPVQNKNDFMLSLRLRTFKDQEVYFGQEGAAHYLRDRLKALGAGKILLVTGKDSFTQSGAAAFLREAGVDLRCRFSEFGPNPTYVDLIEGIKYFRASNPDCIVAAGGGSALDMAKLINLFGSTGVKPAEILEGRAKAHSIVRMRPCVAIPTTAGTGSEATGFSVLYRDGLKHSVADSRMLPETVILNPFLTESMDPYQTACAGFDTLAQGIESHWAVGATAESREYAAKAIHLAWEYLKKAVQSPDAVSRKKMQEAAYWSGRAINISRTTLCHALSYCLTSRFGYPHGHAVALFLPEVFELHLKQGLISRDILNSSCCPSGEAMLREIRNWRSTMGLEAKRGFSRQDMEIVALQVNPERLGNNPVSLIPEDVLSLVRKALSFGQGDNPLDDSKRGT